VLPPVPVEHVVPEPPAPDDELLLAEVEPPVLAALDEPPLPADDDALPPFPVVAPPSPPAPPLAPPVPVALPPAVPLPVEPTEDALPLCVPLLGLPQACNRMANVVDTPRVLACMRARLRESLASRHKS
jgi:hypothetical protein